MADFFSRYSRFFETSGVGAWPDRLSCRHEAIFETNRQLFANARVLDLASHDGRWTLAALDAGAAHVTGIEVRPDLVSAANENMRFYGISDERFTFITDDLNQRRSSNKKYDLVLCLGYFYHTLNHMALFEYMSSTSATYLILDGMIEPSEAPIVRIYSESITEHAHGMSTTGIHDGEMLVGHPSANTLVMLLAHFGYGCAFYDWRRLIERRGISYNLTGNHGPDNPVGDYAQGRRATALARRRS